MTRFVNNILVYVCTSLFGVVAVAVGFNRKDDMAVFVGLALIVAGAAFIWEEVADYTALPVKPKARP